jgi:hypothetical protein
MGMERAVDFPSDTLPTWDQLRDFLSSRGFPLQLRMIDGQLAFPDETPPATWSELRIGTPHGMVTVRRQGRRFTFVTWGNADVAMVGAWNALAWACATLGDGRVQVESGSADATQFAASVPLPDQLRKQL